jgi:Asp-tRNA(Asn)/Glu-tRNA(Gln) amidotransferase A subunit family amidase
MALEAAQADAEIAKGTYRGPLHGIPYGLKDLFAVKGTRTTWGAMPYKDQMIDEDATVVTRLRDAGAVLLAKTSVGALAWGDVWYDGVTKNPWKTDEGSSGSSAGSASATAAGLIGMGIGTETLGSVVSFDPVRGHRASSHLRAREPARGDGSLLEHGQGRDALPRGGGLRARPRSHPRLRRQGRSGDRRSLPLGHRARPEETAGGLRRSRLRGESETTPSDETALGVLREWGSISRQSSFRIPVDRSCSSWSRGRRPSTTSPSIDDSMVRQVEDAWPNVFRAARFIPAVEYIQANRARTILMQRFEESMQGIDVYIHPTFGGKTLLATNLTGHPSVVLPNGFRQNGTPTSITFTGRLFGEADLLLVAKAYQDETGFHLKHPPFA